MPQFEVKYTAVCVALIEAKDQDEALDIASREISADDYEFVEAECSLPIVDPSLIEAMRMHANKVVP